MNKIKKYSIISILVVCVFTYWYTNKPIIHPPGTLGGKDGFSAPIQVKENGIAFKHKDFIIQPLASWNATGLVVSNIEFGVVEGKDITYQISNKDITLAWGTVANQEVTNILKFKPHGRTVFFRYPGNKIPPLTRLLNIKTNQNLTDYIGERISNMHIICKNEIIENQINNIKVGHIIRIEGKLVEVTSNKINMRPWKSSLIRTDKGNGACEIVFVEKIIYYN